MKDKITTALKSMHWQQWLILAAFVVTVGLTGFQVYRTVRATRSWHRHRQEPIRAWMTIPHVAHMHHVPPRVLYEALGVAPPEIRPDRRPLKMIARQQNRTMDQIRAILKDAIQREQSQRNPSSSSAPNGRPAPPGNRDPRPSDRGRPDHESSQPRERSTP